MRSGPYTDVLLRLFMQRADPIGSPKVLSLSFPHLVACGIVHSTQRCYGRNKSLKQSPVQAQWKVHTLLHGVMRYIFQKDTKIRSYVYVVHWFI
jgi:hypothetical protein